MPPSIARRDTETSKCDTIALARKIWMESGAIAGTKAEAYLRARKITADLHEAPLRYHPALHYRESPGAPLQKLPALVAAVSNHEGEIMGIHRTFLDSARNAKADVASPRRSLGAILGHGVRIGVIEDFAIVGEGLETMLSLKSALPRAPIVAALSAGHLAAWSRPRGLRRLVIAADNDDPGGRAARQLSERMRKLKVEVSTIVPLRKDFNNELQSTTVEGMRDRVSRLVYLDRL
jgi:hypothetical protein